MKSKIFFAVFLVAIINPAYSGPTGGKPQISVGKETLKTDLNVEKKGQDQLFKNPPENLPSTSYGTRNRLPDVVPGEDGFIAERNQESPQPKPSNKYREDLRIISTNPIDHAFQILDSLNHPREETHPSSQSNDNKRLYESNNQPQSETKRIKINDGASTSSAGQKIDDNKRSHESNNGPQPEMERMKINDGASTSSAGKKLADEIAEKNIIEVNRGVHPNLIRLNLPPIENLRTSDYREKMGYPMFFGRRVSKLKNNVPVKNSYRPQSALAADLASGIYKWVVRREKNGERAVYHMNRGMGPSFEIQFTLPPVSNTHDFIKDMGNPVFHKTSFETWESGELVEDPFTPRSVEEFSRALGIYQSVMRIEEGRYVDYQIDGTTASATKSSNDDPTRVSNVQQENSDTRSGVNSGATSDSVNSVPSRPQQETIEQPLPKIQLEVIPAWKANILAEDISLFTFFDKLPGADPSMGETYIPHSAEEMHHAAGIYRWATHVNELKSDARRPALTVSLPQSVPGPRIRVMPMESPPHYQYGIQGYPGVIEFRVQPIHPMTVHPEDIGNLKFFGKLTAKDPWGNILPAVYFPKTIEEARTAEIRYEWIHRTDIDKHNVFKTRGAEASFSAPIRSNQIQAPATGNFFFDTGYPTFFYKRFERDAFGQEVKDMYLSESIEDANRAANLYQYFIHVEGGIKVNYDKHGNRISTSEAVNNNDGSASNVGTPLPTIKTPFGLTPLHNTGIFTVDMGYPMFYQRRYAPGPSGKVIPSHFYPESWEQVHKMSVYYEALARIEGGRKVIYEVSHDEPSFSDSVQRGVSSEMGSEPLDIIHNEPRVPPMETRVPSQQSNQNHGEVIDIGSSFMPLPGTSNNAGNSSPKEEMKSPKAEIIEDADHKVEDLVDELEDYSFKDHYLFD